MTPTDQQIAEAWLTLKAAVVFPLLSVTVEEVVDYTDGKISAERAHEVLDHISRKWSFAEDWQRIMEAISEMAEEEKAE